MRLARPMGCGVATGRRRLKAKGDSAAEVKGSWEPAGSDDGRSRAGPVLGAERRSNGRAASNASAISITKRTAYSAMLPPAPGLPHVPATASAARPTTAISAMRARRRTVSQYEAGQIANPAGSTIAPSRLVGRRTASQQATRRK